MATKKTTSKAGAPQKENPAMLFGSRNYLWMAIGLGAIIIGFILLSGGASKHPETEFGESMFNFRRLWIAPLLLLFGFFAEIYAIFRRPKQHAQPQENK